MKRGSWVPMLLSSEPSECTRILVSKKVKVSIAIAALLGAITWGVFIGHYEWPPYRFMRYHFRGLLVKLKPQTVATVEADGSTSNPDEFIHIRSEGDATRVREDLIRFFWGESGFPLAELPVVTPVEAKDSPYPDNTAVRVERLTIEMNYGFNSIAFRFLPQRPNGHLVIFQEGHASERVHNARVTRYFLSLGYEVIYIDMLLQNYNRRPRVTIPRLGAVTINKHDQLRFLESSEFNPLKLFLDPIAASINYSVQTSRPKSISLVGLSGGGALTVTYAAIDRRVTNSFPVAGTAPLYARFLTPETGWGDYEQTHPRLYSVATELDLYILGALGSDRRQFQIFNFYDPCCYPGAAPLTYVPSVRTALAGIGPGNFSVWVDESTFEHEISLRALRTIHELIATRQQVAANP